MGGLHCGHGFCSMYTYGIISLLLLIFVWVKADDYGMDPTLWVVAVFFFGPIAFGLFLILAMGQSRMRRRPEPTEPFHYTPKQEYIPDEPDRQTTRIDASFRDEELESLIADEEFGKARTHLREMIQIARDTHDEGMVRNYSQYSPRINNAAMEAEKRRKREEGR